MFESCHQPPLRNMSGDPSWPMVALFHSCLFGRGLANTVLLSVLGVRHGCDKRTGVVKVVHVNGLDFRYGREFLVVA